MAGFGLYATGEGNAKTQKAVVGGGTPDATVVNVGTGTQQGGTATTPTATTSTTPSSMAGASGDTDQGGSTTPGTTTTTPLATGTGGGWASGLMTSEHTGDSSLDGDMSQKHAKGGNNFVYGNKIPEQDLADRQAETLGIKRFPWQYANPPVPKHEWEGQKRWEGFLKGLSNVEDDDNQPTAPEDRHETFDEYFSRSFKPKKTTEELEKEREKRDRFEALTRGLKSLANLFTTSIGGVSTYDEAKDKAQYEATEDAKMKRARQEWEDYYNRQSLLSNMEYRRSMAQKWQNELANKQADRDFEKWKFDSKMNFDSDKEEERVKEWNRKYEQDVQKLALEGDKAKVDKWYKRELLAIKKEENANNKKLIGAKTALLNKQAAKIGARVTKHTDITRNGGGEPTAYDTTYEYELDD